MYNPFRLFMHNFNANPIVRLDSTFIVRYDGHTCLIYAWRTM
jgi:hypothetical protein